MKKIELTQGKVALVDDKVFEALSQHSWCATRRGKNFYAKRASRGETFYMHREIFRLRGKTPPKKVDHRDRNGLNNTWRNLRPATSSQQMQNRSKQARNKSGYIGVTWDKRTKKWLACASIGRATKNLGRYANPEEAAAARDRFVKKHYGKFAVLNFGSAA